MVSNERERRDIGGQPLMKRRKPRRPNWRCGFRLIRGIQSSQIGVDIERAQSGLCPIRAVSNQICAHSGRQKWLSGIGAGGGVVSVMVLMVITTLRMTWVMIAARRASLGSVISLTRVVAAMFIIVGIHRPWGVTPPVVCSQFARGEVPMTGGPRVAPLVTRVARAISMEHPGWLETVTVSVGKLKIWVGGCCMLWPTQCCAVARTNPAPVVAGPSGLPGKGGPPSP